MKKSLIVFILSSFFVTGFSQKKPVAEIEKMVNRPDVEAPLTFLAADEMRGRDTGSHELDIAANYIASQFQMLQLQVLPGAPSYFQPVELEKSFPIEAVALKLKDDVLKFKDQFILLKGSNSEWSGECVYVGYGTAEEMPSDIKGKMVVAIAGAKDATSFMQIFVASSDKFKRVKAGGGAGLIEFFVTLPIPWPAVVNRFASNPKVDVKAEDDGVPHVWMKDVDVPGMQEIKEQKKVAGILNIGGSRKVAIPAKNVIGKIEGTDPILKNEYLVISAHYDHVGIGAKKDQDSIYNGARDNALGTVALMTAARYFTKYPPKRSVIFMALTGEEKGLLGSKWYAEHPLIPLRQTVFNFNCDGAGYNDKTIATIIGLERTTAEADIVKACAAFGLKAGGDPAPEQNLYERSDNYNFARKGVPAIDFSTGLKSFDAEINKYYHQPADEAGTLDFEYLVKFYRAFVYANYLLANAPKAPVWKVGDKLETVGKTLYQK